MRLIIILIKLISLNLYTFAFSKENLAFINLDEVIKNTNYGKIVLNEIKNLNEKNIIKLKNMEKELESDESELNKKKYVLSSADFENKLSKLTKKIM